MNKVYFKGEEKAIFEAVWAWVIDHSDLNNDGILFLKAHIKSKHGFARSVSYRLKGNYRNALDAEKFMKERQQDVLDKRKMKEAILKVQRENEIALEKKVVRKLFLKIKNIFK